MVRKHVNIIKNGKMFSRRKFLKLLAGTGALCTLPTLMPASSLGRDGILAPSDRITIAMFGCGSRARGSIIHMDPLPDHQIVAVVDCRKERALAVQEIVNNMYARRTGYEHYKGCEETWDFLELLDRPDIDVLWGVVNDHWHGPIYRRMIQSGKDVYGEKPLTRYVHQGLKVCKLVRQHGTIFQVGTQQRSSSHFRYACELARNGYLGKITRVEVGVPGGTICPVAEPCDVPDGFNWDRWSGPAPLLPFDRNRIEWLALYMISHYCAGFITNWGTHHLDIAGWGVPEFFEKPFTVEGTGVMPNAGMSDTWLSWHAFLRYDSGLVLDFSNTGAPNEQGTRFVGDEGWVLVNRNGIWASKEPLLDVNFKETDVRLHVSPGSTQPPRKGHEVDAYTRHTADFFRAVRTRQDPVAPVEQGHAATSLGNLADIACRTGLKLRWDWETHLFDNDEANKMLAPPEREPWTM
ncbi:MAG: Gfo/Idh/MocA family oxidoreductase [Planctomycetia bacterium]|nr:Gfo/Idh/MocA family oxidoreductase [Planctomycetia bacterium]